MKDEATPEQERVAIVAWLRETASPMIAGITHGEVWVLHRAADAIERGDHLKGQDHG